VKKQLYIVRKEFDGFGGAENVAKRYLEAFKKYFNVSLIYAGCEIEGHSIKGNTGPGWARSVTFARSVNEFLSTRKDGIALSMTRGVSAHIFRMGDGVHNKWLKRKNTGIFSKLLNPTHIVTPILEARSIKNSHWIVPNSRLVADEVRDEYKLPTERIKVINNGFDSNRFRHIIKTDRMKLRGKHNLHDSCLHLLFCANGWERKGLSHVIKLAEKLNARIPCHLWIAGRGDHAHYSNLANGIGISESITFLGSVSNTSIWYQMVDVFVLPTLYDPFSNSCLEALACGCPVVTTNSNGAGECIIQENGIIVNAPSAVDSDAVVDWILNARDIDRPEISRTVQSLNSENEITAYLNLLKLDE